MYLCYECGQPIEKKDLTKEHIPPKNLFMGRGEEFKINLCTVPAHKKCNESYNKTDEEFRNLIAVITKQPGHDGLINNAVKALIRGEAAKSRHVYNEVGEVVGVKFQPQLIIEFHKKNFKGLYYRRTGIPIPNNYKILVDINALEGQLSESQLEVIGYLQTNFNWQYVGHPDIFQYILQPLKSGYKFDGNDLKIESNERFMGALLRYNLTHTAYVGAELLI